ncbi:unnamed protein product [Penicillium manginii]
MAMVAVGELRQAISIVTRCNSAFQALDSNKDSSSGNLPLHTAISSYDKPDSRKSWTVIQGFCIDMRGAILVTEDEWTYPVLPSNVAPLIETGVIKHSHLRERDIQDRAKADSFAKAFTMLQTFWVTCNIIARAAYNLPITPLEISTVAYAVCAGITYAVWWHKPKDMVTPIMIYLPYGRESDAMPRRPPSKNLKPRTVSEAKQSATPEQNYMAEQNRLKDEDEKLTVKENMILDLCSLLIALLFCGIHVAA